MPPVIDHGFGNSREEITWCNGLKSFKVHSMCDWEHRDIATPIEQECIGRQRASAFVPFFDKQYRSFRTGLTSWWRFKQIIQTKGSCCGWCSGWVVVVAVWAGEAEEWRFANTKAAKEWAWTPRLRAGNHHHCSPSCCSQLFTDRGWARMWTVACRNKRPMTICNPFNFLWS